MPNEGRDLGSKPITAGLKYATVRVGSGSLSCPYVEYTYEAVPKVRDVSRESGVGPSMKENTRAAGILYREDGSSDEMNLYPAFVVDQTEFRLWDNVVSENRGDSPSYATWLAVAENTRASRMPNVYEELVQRELEEAGWIPKIQILLSAFNCGLHQYISWNSLMSIVYSSGAPGLIGDNAGGTEFGLGTTVSKNGLRDAMRRLEDRIKDMPKNIRPWLFTAFPPILGAYEQNLKRTLTRVGLNGIGNISQEDIFHVTAGNAYCIGRRSVADRAVHPELDGVDLLAILDELANLTQALDNIWDKVVAKVLKTFMVPVLKPTATNYLDHLMKFQASPTDVLDHDFMHALTRQLALFSFNTGAMVEQFTPFTGGWLEFYWTKHNYRPPSYILYNLFRTFPGATYTWQLWYPKGCVGVHSWYGSTIGADVTNYFLIVWPHRPSVAVLPTRRHFSLLPIYGTETASVVLATRDPVTNSLFLQAQIETASAMGIGVYTAGGPSLANIIHQGIHEHNIWRAMVAVAPYLRYTRWTRDGGVGYQNYVDQMYEWIIAYFDGEDVRPAVWYHLKYGSGRERDQKTGERVDKSNPGPFDAITDEVKPKKTRKSTANQPDEVAGAMDTASTATELEKSMDARKERKSSPASTGPRIPDEQWKKMTPKQRWEAKHPGETAR